MPSGIMGEQWKPPPVTPRKLRWYYTEGIKGGAVLATYYAERRMADTQQLVGYITATTVVGHALM